MAGLLSKRNGKPSQKGTGFSFPVGLFHPLHMPVYPGALRFADDTAGGDISKGEFAS
jgi:hypothetical protein